jgi:hypothetical protein
MSNPTTSPIEIRPGKALSAAVQFIDAMFGNTTGQICICRYPNTDDRDPGKNDLPKHWFTRDLAKIDRLIRDHNGPGHGIFFCIATVREGATTRSKETVSELIGLHCDVDFNARYRFDELLDWIKRWGAPLLTRKPTEKTNAAANGNPFVDNAAGTAGRSIDSEARLAAMTYQRAGDSGRRKSAPVLTMLFE